MHIRGNHAFQSPPVFFTLHIVHAADTLHHVFLENSASTVGWPICMGTRQLLRPLIRTADQWIIGLKEGIKEACRILILIAGH
jgi:hypothetical protein